MLSANYPLSNKPLFVTPYKEVLSFASEREKSLRVTFIQTNGYGFLRGIISMKFNLRKVVSFQSIIAL